MLEKAPTRSTPVRTRGSTRKLLLYTAGALTIAAAGITAIGYALPQNHAATREARLSAPPATVFGIISDVPRHPDWRADVSRVDMLRTDPLTWREHSNGDVITFAVEESRPPALLRVRITDPDLPFGGSWTYELAADGTGTRLRITENGEVYNPLFRFMSRFVFGHTATIDRFITELRARVR